MIDPRRSELTRIAVCITGASGVVMGFRLCEVLNSMGIDIVAILSYRALEIAEYEIGSARKFFEDIEKVSKEVYLENDLDAPISSSGNTPDATIVIPASMKTIALIVNGVHNNLITRVSLNTLRMKRKLVVVPRETPLGPKELENLYRLSLQGALIVPAMIAMYIKPRSVNDIIDFIVGKVLDVLGIEHSLYRKWYSLSE